jgi:hypothetical protein
MKSEKGGQLLKMYDYTYSAHGFMEQLISCAVDWFEFEGDKYKMHKYVEGGGGGICAALKIENIQINFAWVAFSNSWLVVLLIALT